MRDRVCVIGSGIAGLASAWLLSQRHDVTLIEKNGYFGGHTNTIDVDEDGSRIPVDTGFIVYNTRNYPLFVRFLARLSVPTRASDMSFAASIGPGRVEYGGDGPHTIFAQRRNLVSPRFLRMLVDILRFGAVCRRCLRDSSFNGRSLGRFLADARLGDGFRDHYLLPMAAAIWSCPPATMLEFPAESLARFFDNHRLLNPLERPAWRTVADGSQSYVKRIAADLGPARMVQDGAVSVQRREAGARVQLASGRSIDCDRVVLACHADHALALIEQPTELEADLLARFRYQPNRTFLHTDARLMPARRVVWSAWNYLAADGADGDKSVSVTYWMNRLQGLTSRRDYFVSLNPLTDPDPATVIREMTYDHPVYDQAAMDAQPELHRLQGADRLYFCGSYHGYGFHEDALRAAVDVADRLGADTGWLTGDAAEPAPDALPLPTPVGVPA
ncbi:NAD(P)/FAD-dependent oxidoreductase [Thiohalocapsa sp. ML1]|uniref:NAD(P)/FAD-dependent oxidoreductase n=1 Tax=Thiohalocapsa sp. ML1 TaxID=1431688 RepID=UPI0007320A12|nr:FAD-dependent oxidoreductase [Thiohalocapsa sp. ML1]